MKLDSPQETPVVWILEDSPMEAAMARRALVPRYEVEVFSDGSTLLERMASTTPPTVLVLDLQLPGMTGIEVCRFLRSNLDEVALPILMLTVYGHKSDLLDGLAAGANDYLTKPYDASELVARVSTLARVKTLFQAAKVADEQRRDLLGREQAARLEIASLLERERDARREAEAANAAKDGFVAMVSHELRTPLNAILGWTRLLRGDELAVDRRGRALETIERNAVAQTQLIDDLLDMSRVLSGQLRIDVEPVELVNIVNLSVEAIRPTALAKGIRIQQRIDPNGGRVEGDPARLQQVVGNILTNAVKFTPQDGTIVVTLQSHVHDVEICVGDTGRGIDPAFLPHVFERFRQAEEGPKRSRGGLGLGLAIVRHIVELHSGTVLAESAGSDQGSTFRVLIPRLADAIDRSTPHLGDEASTVKLEGVRILVVDDDPDALELIATLVRRYGATVEVAASAEIAFRSFESAVPDLIVSDIAMPVEDGHELIRRIRALPADRGGRTPALALTAFAAAEDRKRALAAGFNMYISKPPDRDELVVSIANLAGRLPAPSSGE